MDGRDRDWPFAEGRCAFDILGANVADREYAGQTRLETRLQLKFVFPDCFHAPALDGLFCTKFFSFITVAPPRWKRLAIALPGLFVPPVAKTRFWSNSVTLVPCLAGAFIRVLRHSRFQKSLNAVAHSMGDEATNQIFGVRVVSGRKLNATLARRAAPPGIPAFCDIRLDGSPN